MPEGVIHDVIPNAEASVNGVDELVWGIPHMWMLRALLPLYCCFAIVPDTVALGARLAIFTQRVVSSMVLYMVANSTLGVVCGAIAIVVVRVATS